MHEVTPLSGLGEQRRLAMRSSLLAAVGQRRRWRRARRAAAAGLLLACGGYAFWPAAPAPVPPVVAKAPSYRVQILGNDASLLARWSVGGPPRTVQYLDDAGLVQELARDGRPASLLRSGTRIEVLPQVGGDWQLAP